MPFFLQAAIGQRFSMLHEPVPTASTSASKPAPVAILYVHPFGEEMNRSRRMAALQARALAAAGATVLQIDLYGCGDSSDDFADARWDTWKTDLALAQAWLAERTGAPVYLWGLRLGALLALDHARDAAQPVAGLLLWQPVTIGRNFLTQFLRLRLANAMLERGVDYIGHAGTGNSGADGGTAALRASLAQGRTIEIAGYDLAPELAAAIDAAVARNPAPVGMSVDWFDIQADAAAPVLPATARIADGWRNDGVDLRLHQVEGPAFWTSSEITEAPSLLDATVAALRERMA